MLSKNNRKEQLLKQEPKKQRFTIKKLTIGVASVLIGFTFMGMNASADATTDTHSNTANQEAIQTNIDSGSKTLNNEQTNSSNSVANGSTNNTVSNDANNQNLVTSQGIDQNKIAQNTTAEPAQNSQVQSVNDYSQFLNALQNKNISTITLDKNIDFSNANLNNGSYQDINNYGIARTVTIDGQNQYALNMGNNYIDLDSNTYYEPNASNPTRNWNVILKDLNLQTTSGYGPFWFNGATSNDSTLTFNGVTTSKDSGQLLNNSTASSYPNVNVSFEGQNKLQGSLNNSNITSSALIQANNVNFSNGSTVFTANNNSSSDLADIEASGNVVVDGSAQVDFNSEATSNMAGISFAEGGAGNQTIDNATSGVLRLMPNAQVTMELGSGASMGVNNASNLDLQDNSSLKITTSKMNSTGFRSAGLVGLDYDGDTNDSTVRISPNAVLSVIRTNVTNSDAPLLAMGPNSGNGEIYHLEVNSGSLNLQDSAYSSYLPSSYTLSKSQYSGGWPAILTMWGTSSQNYINFNNAKLINLQRTAPNKPGYLIKTEGAGDYAYHQTHIVINSPDSAYNTPLTIIPAGETKPVTWNVKYLNNTSQGGDYAYAFRSYRDFGDWNNVGSEYMNGSVNDNTPAKGVNEVILTPSASDPGSNSFSNGAIVPEGSETKASKALNNFINHFSWWNTSGVKFGSSLDENNQYTPSYKPVTVEQGQSATDNPTFTNQDGKDVTAPTGTTFATGTDTPNWATIDPATGTVTVNPGTDVTPGAYNVPVIVTYSDKSTDDTTVPVIVTKAGQTVTWGVNGAIVTTVDVSKLNAHETTKNSQVLSAGSIVTAEGYELTDGKLSTTATPITIDPSTVSWTTTPDTNVETATASGKEIENNSIKIDFTNNDAAKNILGSKNDMVTTNPFTIDAKGAGAKNVTVPVNIQYQSDLTSEQFNQLVDNNIPSDEIASTTWATKPNEQGQDGVIKITFTDKAANGEPTYLNVNIPASSIKVTTDADKYAPKGQTIIIKQGEIPSAPDGIGNKDQLPKSTTYTWQNTPNNNEPGKKPAVVVVTYPDGSKANVPTNIIVDANPEVKPITTTVNGNPAATEGIANLDNGGTTPVDGYPSSATWTTKPDTSKPGATTGTATVTYPDGTTETVTIPVAVNGGGDVVIINNGHVFSLHANNVVTHKTSDKNIIGEPVIENFKLSYYEGGQNYSKPYIYTLNGTGTEYILTQPGDNPIGVTVNAPQSINASEIKINWTAAGTPLFSNALGEIKGNGQPSSLVSDHDNNTGTQIYTGSQNDQYGYPMYSATVDSSSVNWPIYGKGPVSTYPFPSVYIYGAEANGTIPSVNSDTIDLKAALGDASKLVNTSDLTAAHNAEISSVVWQKLPSLEEANAKAPATVRINFIDGSYLDVPVAVNVIKVDQGINNKTNSEIYRDITRTINVEGESTPVVQHVIYSRAKVTNLSKPAGQQVTYTNWAPAKNSEGQAVTIFSQFNVTKPGYTATAIGATIQTNDGQQYVPASATITPDSQNETVDVTYTANEHMLVINYVDGNGNVVGTYNVPGKTDETVNVDVPENVPTNWKLVPGQQVIGSYKFGSNDPQPVDYKVEHGTAVVPVDKNNKNTYRTITQTIQKVLVGQNKAKTVRSIIVPFQRTGIKDLVTGEITWNAWQGPEGSVDKDGQSTYMIPAYTITPQKGYDTYVNGEKNTANQIPAVDVTAASKNITDIITYVREGSTPVPYDPSNKDMNMSVTRIINYEVPTGHATITPVIQTIEYIRDNDGVAGYRDPVTGDITWNPWHVKNGDAQFPSTSVTQITGYDSYVDGTKTTEVPAVDVVEKDGTPQNGKTVTVNYQKQGTTQTDADKYTPEGQDVNTKTGVVPDPADGIKNKSDLPEGTKYTWKNTPDVTTAGDKTGTVIVTYPDGSKDEVPVTIRVTNPTTDADKYTADGGNITVDKGHVLTPTDAENAIVNHSDLPEGTTYTWKYAPDTNTVGNKNGVVTVTYPDGSVDEVPVMVHVVDDADKYDPQGQTITIKKGDPVPSAEQGIKNASELPSGTKYTWDVAPDPAKVGSQPVIITVNYPDGSQDQVPTTVIVTDTTTPSETDADKYNPQGQVVNVDRGAKLPDASEGIANKDTLPDGTKYTWKNAPDTSTTGDKPAVITVTYPDGSKEDVPTIVHVNSTDADKYTPQGQNITVDKGAKVPGAATAITNKRELPADTKYTWETTPDTNKVGVQPAVVIVTYPDGSQDNVPVIITVKNPETQPGTTTDVDKYTPEGGTIVTTIGANLTNDAPEGIVNKDALPAGTKYSWTNGTPSTSQAGLTMHYVTVTYPDGSSEVVPVYVNVTSDADKYSPEPQTVTVKKGETPNPADGIKNKGDLPGSTKYTWKTIPDTTTSGDKPAVIVVTYPDGSNDEVPTVVHVTNPATDADKYTPETQPITTPEGKVPDASDGIKNKTDLPNGTKYTWTDPDRVAQDVKKPGSHTETITITYPDGSEDTVTVTVNVPAPEGQNITTDQGQLPNPADAIKNKDQMPAGTTYTWKQEPDVSTPGDHTGVVEVRFPDGTTSEVTVIVHVDAVTPDNGGNMHYGNGSIDHQNGTEINNGSVIENATENSVTNSTSQQPAKTLPQTGNDSSKFSALAGLSLAAVASFFGFADHDKKRKADK
ncbi:YPDG domain-containing protein [Limosilactobacillus reuteri]|uniref:Rib/alpha-like domain-containing protein n=1 Tax=Limosilactobacillus reuteri TaxID=1598 RepID=UPI001E61B7F8|nr:Rib/alpha-like domain-containing protein [Limosilactobacillus reuteri]MCC4436280.1 YPDG domain-containing protein [Limosilactobacillus reuteri]MCC4437444.1 YPDG domain-containing protein [Limosilactobacillus reuteri]MCC4442412.1 YPDG domain-containing protein [Limosilactobacillus reuteri]MCC4444153.1 YPDG domain-containing protein [Limosilactobacillus reuteri]MCC4446518.1 YPDG domain-containing protein [Limosilactobacillus reuteri]